MCWNKDILITEGSFEIILRNLGWSKYKLITEVSFEIDFRKKGVMSLAYVCNFLYHQYMLGSVYVCSCVFYMFQSVADVRRLVKGKTAQFRRS